MSASDLEDLYREIILDHYRRPRNRAEHLEGGATCSAEGANPLCGDEIRLEVRVEDGTIEDIAFGGTGCSISQASASMMTDDVKGRPIAEALAEAARFQQMMVTGEAPDEEMGDIEALIGVAKFPARVKCASLAWKTLEQALRESGAESVTTDERSQQHG